MLRVLLALILTAFIAVPSMGMEQMIVQDVHPTSGAAWTTNVDFRATSTYVTDGTKTAYEIADSSYQSRVSGVIHPPTNGGTVPDSPFIGWDASGIADSRDRNSALDPRLAGMNFVSSSATTYYIQMSSSHLTCNIAFALGDPSNTDVLQIKILDGIGGSVLKTIPASAATAGPNQYVAADGNTYADSNLAGLSVTTSATFTANNSSGTTVAAFELVNTSAINSVQWISMVCP